MTCLHGVKLLVSMQHLKFNLNIIFIDHLLTSLHLATFSVPFDNIQTLKFTPQLMLVFYVAVNRNIITVTNTGPWKTETNKMD